MAKAKRKEPAVKGDPFPWLLFLALLASIYLFWVLPRQLGPTLPKVEFSEAR